MSSIKLSSPATREFWEVPVLFEDAHLLALDKPPDLLASPDRFAPERPSLMALLHQGIASGKPWAASRGLTYLSNAHRLDVETTGVFLLAKSKAALIELANLFGSRKPVQQYLALVHGNPTKDEFQINSKLASQPDAAGLVRVDPRNGKRSETRFTVLERFAGKTLLRCDLLTDRPHQIRAHLLNAGLRVVGDALYGGKPLWLSRLKRDYRLKPGREERPLISRTALHAEHVSLSHPLTGEQLSITAPWPKDLRVAIKYLRDFSSGHSD